MRNAYAVLLQFEGYGCTSPKFGLASKKLIEDRLDLWMHATRASNNLRGPVGILLLALRWPVCWR